MSGDNLINEEKTKKMSAINLVYLYLLSPLHTGGTTQEGNLLGIARESHTNLPYIPSSTIRGRLRASTSNTEEIEINGQKKSLRFFLFGNEIADGAQLEQGAIWIGDGSILWIPVPSLSHGVVWVSSPMLLNRWKRLSGSDIQIPQDYSTNITGNGNVYLKDAILKKETLHNWNNDEWKKTIPQQSDAFGINPVLVLPDKHCATIVQMSLWRQVKIKLDEHKTVDGGFRYEEAIPPDTLMYFPWGVTSQANSKVSRVDSKSNEDKNNTEKDESNPYKAFNKILENSSILQIGGQESLGRGFVQLMYNNTRNNQENQS